MSVEMKNSIKGLENYSPTVEQTHTQKKTGPKKKITDNQTSQSNIQNIGISEREQKRSNRAFFTSSLVLSHMTFQI